MPLVMILDGLTDTRNFGAIARTAECAGFDTIVIPERGSVSVNGDAVKTSAGALLHLRSAAVRSAAEAATYLMESGVQNRGCFRKRRHTVY